MSSKINASELKIVLLIAAIFSFRILGLFMLLPVISSYSEILIGANKINLGFALGIYGLTQVIFQIPFSILSDRWGRIKVIVLGLVIFMVGSIIAALSTSIEGLILGRAVQGIGTIGSTLLALVADVTREGVRTVAMAVVGISIGISFSAAIVLGPWLFVNFGGASIFWVTAGMAVLALAFVMPIKKQYAMHMVNAQVVNFTFKSLLANGVLDLKLFSLNISILLLHTIFSAAFLFIPQLLLDVGIKKQQLWSVYLPILFVAIIVSLGLMRLSEKQSYFKKIMLFAIVSLALALWIWHYFSYSLSGILVGLLLFFTAFNVLEAILPSAVTKLAPINIRGSVMGIFSTFQFIGIFLGGSLGGIVSYKYGITGLIYFGSVLVLIWTILISKVKLIEMSKIK